MSKGIVGEIPKIRPLWKVILGEELRKEKRVPLPLKTKREVYERAGGRCESCGRPLKMNEGEFHHLRKPSVKSTASTIQFLCPTCHRKYGHEWRTRTVHTILGTEKRRYIKRKKVRKHRSPYWEKRKKTVSRKRKQTRKRRKQ